MAVFSEPSPRWGHFSTAVEGQLYVYGGRTEDFAQERSSLASTVHVFDPSQESWQEKRPEGPAPPGLVDGACASVGHHAFFYGGHDGTEQHGSLHQLDTRTLSWTQLSASGPMRTSACEVISYDDKLLLFGDHTQSGAKNAGFNDGGVSTNELHTFCLKGGEGVACVLYWYSGCDGV